ncbi:MAG: DUF6624 domain-containing protein [Balneola sp.]
MTSLKKSSNTYTLITTFLLIFIIQTSCKNDSENEYKWAENLTEAYAALHKVRNLKSADLIFEATENMPVKNWENYFVTATIYAEEEQFDKAFLSLEKAITNGLTDSSLIADYPDFKNLKAHPEYDRILRLVQRARADYLGNIENPDLLKKLENMWVQDQQALSAYENELRMLDSTATYRDYQELFKPVEEIWEINKNKLDSIITIHGWPGNKLVGKEGTKIAWAIPQHHPDVFYKQKNLELIKRAVAEGDLAPNFYAELSDRIARETWQKQTYGASMDQYAPYPIEDPSNVNKRRFELGLMEPIEVYAYYHGIEYKAPTKKEAEILSRESFRKAQNHYVKFDDFIKENTPDSANTYILKAINFYGDISNQQLFEAAVKLAPLSNDRSKRIAENILEVLVWRKWTNRLIIPDHEAFTSLKERDEWVHLEEMIEKSL